MRWSLVASRQGVHFIQISCGDHFASEGWLHGSCHFSISNLKALNLGYDDCGNASYDSLPVLLATVLFPHKVATTSDHGPWGFSKDPELYATGSHKLAGVSSFFLETSCSMLCAQGGLTWKCSYLICWEGTDWFHRSSAASSIGKEKVSRIEIESWHPTLKNGMQRWMSRRQCWRHPWRGLRGFRLDLLDRPRLQALYYS